MVDERALAVTSKPAVSACGRYGAGLDAPVESATTRNVIIGEGMSASQAIEMAQQINGDF